MKLQETFVVLQTGGVSENLNEAILRMIDHDTCNAALYGSVTDKMVCTLPPSGIMGPCYVRCLQY